MRCRACGQPNIVFSDVLEKRIVAEADYDDGISVNLVAIRTMV